jgi:NADH:ubiquinone oxidoreductase subunit 6 (subunit J)
VLSALGVVSSAWLVWSAIVISVTMVFWAAIYRFMGESVLYAVCYPLGVALLLYIAIGGVLRGRRVEWKERTYVSS